VNFTKDGSASTCPIRQLPARDFETLIKAVLADLGTNQTILQACVDAAKREAVTSVDDLENALARHRDEMGRFTASIHRLIEVMKEEDLLADALKDEYRRLVREKEALQARCVKLEFDIERRRKLVLDAEVIRHSLEDFARLVELLPLEDQRELFQLLLREVVVEPFDPMADEPSGEAALTTKVRTRWYRVQISLYQLPGVALVNQTVKSSDLGGNGSPQGGKIRTCLSLTVFAGPNDAWKSPVGRFFHGLEEAQSRCQHLEPAVPDVSASLDAILSCWHGNGMPCSLTGPSLRGRNWLGDLASLARGSRRS
jgi:hypothetical protein